MKKYFLSSFVTVGSFLSIPQIALAYTLGDEEGMIMSVLTLFLIGSISFIFFMIKGWVWFFKIKSKIRLSRQFILFFLTQLSGLLIPFLLVYPFFPPYDPYDPYDKTLPNLGSSVDYTGQLFLMILLIFIGAIALDFFFIRRMYSLLLKKGGAFRKKLKNILLLFLLLIAIVFISWSIIRILYFFFLFFVV